MKISFKSAIITGSSGGLGRAIAVKVAQEGVQKIAVHSLTRRNEAPLSADELRRRTLNVCALLCRDEAPFLRDRRL